VRFPERRNAAHQLPHFSAKISVDFLNKYSFFRILTRPAVLLLEASRLQCNLQKNSTTCKRSEFLNDSPLLNQNFYAAYRIFVLGTIFAPMTPADSVLTECAKKKSASTSKKIDHVGRFVLTRGIQLSF